MGWTSTDTAQAAELAASLVETDEPAALLPDPLPCPPLDLLVELHTQTTRAMLADLAQARRAGAAALAVAARFPDDALLQAQAHWTQGTAILYIPDYTRSLAHYDAALEWYARACAQHAPQAPPRDVRIVQIVRVACLSELGRYDEALAAAQAAEDWLADHPNNYARLTLLLNRSFLAGQMGDYPGMLELADQTIALATQLDVPARLAHGWLNRAVACMQLGRYEDAADAHNQGQMIAAAADEPITVARAQLSRALLLRYQGQMFAALTEMRQAEQGLSQAQGEVAALAWIEATIAEQLRQLPEALQAARRAAELFASQNMPAYSANAALHAVKLAVQQRQRSNVRALLDLARAQVKRMAQPLLDAELALVEAQIACAPAPELSAQALRRRRTQAYSAAKRAAATFEAHGFVRNAAEGQLILAALELALGERDAAAARYRALAHETTIQIALVASAELGRLLPPDEALPYFSQAAALAVEQRRALPMEELQARYSSETSLYHTRLAACHLALGETAQGYTAICEAKAGPLLDLRASTAAVDAQDYTQLERFKADLVRWRDQAREHLSRAHAAAQQGNLKQSRYHAERAEEADAQAQTVAHTLTEAIRTLGDRNGQARVPTPEEIGASLPQGLVALEFAQCEDDLIGFLLRPARPVVWRRLGAYAELAPLLDRWSLVRHRLLSVSAQDAERQTQVALGPLWDLLLSPWAEALADCSQLLIAPQGVLHHVPWAMLWDGAAYLSERVALTLTPCLALWAAPLEGPAEPPGPPRLLGAPGAGATRLAHVAGELEAIRRSLPDAQIYPAASAAELRATPPPRILHIAAHAHTNAAVPLCSALELSDGPMLLLEAHRLKLRGVELVTLSACETSLRPDYGDMVLALAGAFLCAGASAVLASLWPVADDLTALLMEQFYAGLAQGLPLALALQQAQQVARAANPLDWAAFQLWAGVREDAQQHISS